MNTLSRYRNVIWAAFAMIAGVSTLMVVEIIEEPTLTLTEILFELIEPTLIVLTVSGVVYLLGRTRRQHQEQLALLQDMEVARSEGQRWRADMRELLKGLSAAIDAQFDRWKLSQAEREIALLLLKGLTHKEIAVLRDTSERTIRQQSQSIYEKSNLSGRASLSAFFLEDLLLPRSLG